MTSIDRFSTHPGAIEKEHGAITPHVVDLEPMKENALKLVDARPLEVRGDFSRIATFELGSNVNDEGERVKEIDPANPHAVILDVWTGDDKVFALPRSINTDEAEDITRKGWDLADWPTGLPVGRARNDLWREKTGEELPQEVSGRHFGLAARNGELLFADVGSTNGTRMEVAALSEAQDLSDAEVTVPRERVFAGVTRELVEVPSSLKTSETHDTPVTQESPRDKDMQLQSMKNLAHNWELTLGAQPTFTHSEQLYGVSASMSGDTITLRGIRESMKPQDNSPISRLLNELEATAMQIQMLAATVAGNIEGRVYSTGAEAHADRRRVEGLLRHYSSSLTELQRLISK
ncbi:MAG TPA: hypothetical protein VFT59_04395 [Candidatus Saccharimonadales bacterium]|nr:hypothetical protein [Candidatus Saccharimonadales bacterium]